MVREWVSRFSRGDADAIADCYTETATNHQVVREPVVGRDAIREMFAFEFSRAKMVCQIENRFQDGDWAILEWTDPNGLRGCGFFRCERGEIAFQRG
ncbi:MAG: nuclear transport factor 2 family protein [Pseudomonadota bacterium]